MNNQKIRNIEDLRGLALLTLEKLRDREIDTSEAAATGKVVDSVLGTIKSQLEYARATQTEANIEFMQGRDDKLTLEYEKNKELEYQD